MAFRDRNRQDFNAGIMYIGIGAFFGGFATNYPMGTAVRMGPAYFPSILGALLALLGMILVFRSFFMHRGELPSKTHWRPLCFILGAACLFGYLIGPAGLVPSAFVMMIVGSLGGWQFNWKEQVVSAIFMTAAVVGIFHFGLGLPFKLFPWS